MTGLVLRLKPHEKFLINGIELQNGERATRLRVRSTDVAILRASDAIAPHEATTPLKRLYYICQLAVAGEADPHDAAREVEPTLRSLEPLFRLADAGLLEEASAQLAQHKFFLVMRALKKLFPIEKALLERKEVA